MASQETFLLSEIYFYRQIKYFSVSYIAIKHALIVINKENDT